MSPLRKLVEKTNLSYNEEGKQKFHAYAKHFLARVANEMKLVKGTYDIRSNMGGIAGSGEVTLHAHNLYVQISQGMSPLYILVRKCNGLKDYTGLSNNWMPVEKLDSVAEFAEFCNSVANKESFFVV